MSVPQIERELATVAERVAALRREIGELEAWESELQTSLRVLTRLSDGSHGSARPHMNRNAQSGERAQDQAADPSDVHATTREATVRDAGRTLRHRSYDRARSLATGVPLQAGQALIAMLRAKGDFIRQMEAVERLRAEHGIRIGRGRPGRETSDLSAALGHGKVPGLVVTRSDGWGLEEWEGVPRAKRQAAPVGETAAQDAADPGDPDLMRGDQIMRDAEAERERLAAEDQRQNGTVLHGVLTGS